MRGRGLTSPPPLCCSRSPRVRTGLGSLPPTSYDDPRQMAIGWRIATPARSDSRRDDPRAAARGCGNPIADGIGNRAHHGARATHHCGRWVDTVAWLSVGSRVASGIQHERNGATRPNHQSRRGSRAHVHEPAVRPRLRYADGDQHTEGDLGIAGRSFGGFDFGRGLPALAASGSAWALACAPVRPRDMDYSSKSRVAAIAKRAQMGEGLPNSKPRRMGA